MSAGPEKLIALDDDTARYVHDRIMYLASQRFETRENIRELEKPHTTIDIECGERKIVFKGSSIRPTPELKEVLRGYLTRYVDECTLELALLGYVEGSDPRAGY